jgi:hypothetical protein
MANTPMHCENLDQVANSILTHSFAIYRVDHDTHESLVKAWIASRNFLSHIHVNTTSTRMSSKNIKHTNSGSSGKSNSASVTSGSGSSHNNSSPSALPPSSHDNSIQAYLKKYRNIYNGNLYGLNRPSEAKLLFRAFFCDTSTISNQEENQCKGKSYSEGDNDSQSQSEGQQQRQQHQPWPDDFDGGELKNCSKDLSTKLHNILFNCLEAIYSVIQQKEEIDDELAGTIINLSTNAGAVMQQPISASKAKAKTTSTSTSTSHLHKKQKLGKICTNVQDDFTITRTAVPTNQSSSSSSSYTHSSLSPVTQLKSKALLCPLDFFLYHNERKNSNYNTTRNIVHNCTQHIDRGALICISLTNVQGLEVLSNNNSHSKISNEWICPEEWIKSLFQPNNRNLYNENGCDCSQFICILAGDQLLKVLSSLEQKEDEEKQGHGCEKGKEEKENTLLYEYKQQYPGLAPCIHRVRDDLCRARLSISYELRM